MPRINLPGGGIGAKLTPRKRSIYGSGSGALTPTLPTNEAADMLDRQQLLGNLENKLNAQQKRIADNDRFIKVMKKEATEMRKLITKRHGQVHVYRDNLYASAKEAQAALFEDTKAVPVDHDLIVMMYEEAFPPGAFDEAKWDDVVRYMASKAHRDALAMSEEMGATTGNLSRHDKTVNRVLNAERKLAALTDPLPPSLHEKLGIDRETFRLLMKGKVKNRATVREALREWLYQLRASGNYTTASYRPEPHR